MRGSSTTGSIPNRSLKRAAAASAAVERLDALFAALAAYREERADDPGLDAIFAEVREGFVSALDDDLNISPALAALFEGVRELNRRLDARALSTADAARSLAFLDEVRTSAARAGSSPAQR